MQISHKTSLYTIINNNFRQPRENLNSYGLHTLDRTVFRQYHRASATVALSHFQLHKNSTKQYKSIYIYHSYTTALHYLQFLQLSYHNQSVLHEFFQQNYTKIHTTSNEYQRQLLHADWLLVIRGDLSSTKVSSFFYQK